MNFWHPNVGTILDFKEEKKIKKPQIDFNYMALNRQIMMPLV
jgi:hypothetical protein